MNKIIQVGLRDINSDKINLQKGASIICALTYYDQPVILVRINQDEKDFAFREVLRIRTGIPYDPKIDEKYVYFASLVVGNTGTVYNYYRDLNPEEVSPTAGPDSQEPEKKAWRGRKK